LDSETLARDTTALDKRAPDKKVLGRKGPGNRERRKYSVGH
jgi:hypothetical protein